jgi:membrane-bound metal-dependent hydrolase YbcI (DUF457 family)
MEPLIHFVVPFTALTLAGVKFRRALPISLLALLPDLDALLLIHRSLSHSLIILLIAATPITLLISRFKPNLQRPSILGLLSVASHLALDIFTGYTPILWPLYSYSIWVKVELTTHIGSSLNLSLNACLLLEPTTFHRLQSLDASLLTGEGLILSTALLTPLLLKAFTKYKHPLKERN